MRRNIFAAASASDVREANVVVLCAYVIDGVSPEGGYAIRDALNGVETIGWWFWNPGTFVVAFASDGAGAQRAEACEAELRKVSALHPSLEGMGIGISEGRVIAPFSSKGVLESLPLGGSVVGSAAQKARENAS